MVFQAITMFGSKAWDSEMAVSSSWRRPPWVTVYLATITALRSVATHGVKAESEAEKQRPIHAGAAKIARRRLLLR